MRERVEKTRVRKKKKIGKKEESNKREKIFCMWNIWTYGLLL